MIKKIAKSSSLLMSSNVFVAVGGLITISLIAKKLSISDLGIFAIIQTYVLAMNSLISFQTWYTVNKYYPLVKDDDRMLASLLKYSYKLDLITAAIGTMLSILLINFLGNYINIPDSYFLITQIFSLSILFNIVGTATGYFRSIDKYKVLVYSDIIATIFRVIGIIICYEFFPSIEAFLIVILISFFVKTVYLNYSMLMHKLNAIILSDTSLIRKKFIDIHGYSITTSITNGFDILFRQGDILLVSIFFGTYYAGVFKMIKTFSGLIGQVTGPISIVIYPIISELIHKSQLKELKHLLLKSLMLLTLVGSVGLLLFIFLEDRLITILFTSDYLIYTGYLNFYIFIIVLSIVFMAIHPIANLIGLHKETMYLTIIKLPIFIIIIYLLKDYFSFKGFLIAVLIETIITICIKFFWVYKKINTERSK